jgi:hypothetical protein
LDIAAASFKVLNDRLNEAELKEQLALVHRWCVSANSSFRQASVFSNSGMSEVIGPLPQIAPKKQWVASLWHSGCGRR